MAEISFVTYGVRVGVRVEDVSLLPRVINCLPPGWKQTSTLAVDCSYSIATADGANKRAASKPQRGKRRMNLLYRDGDEIARTSDIEQLFETFESNLQLYIAEMSPRKVFVHAGVVGWRGQAILIPGRSMSGKTTLVHELVRAGAIYYSDEYAVLDERGRVHPFAKPLAIRQPDNFKQVKHAVEEFGGRAGTTSLPVGLVVVSKYRDGARWQPRRLTEGRGALELLANAIAARRQPKRVIATLQKVVRHAPVIKSARGKASNAVEAILAALNELPKVS